MPLQNYVHIKNRIFFRKWWIGRGVESLFLTYYGKLKIRYYRILLFGKGDSYSMHEVPFWVFEDAGGDDDPSQFWIFMFDGPHWLLSIFNPIKKTR